MDYERAVTLTETIRQTAKQADQKLHVLLREAHDEAAWKAMEYPNWRAYVESEFDLSGRNADRYLDLSRAIEAFVEVMADLDNVVQTNFEPDISVAQAGRIKKKMPAAKETFRRKVEEERKTPAQAVKETLEEHTTMEKRDKVAQVAAEYAGDTPNSLLWAIYAKCQELAGDWSERKLLEPLLRGYGTDEGARHVENLEIAIRQLTEIRDRLQVEVQLCRVH